VVALRLGDHRLDQGPVRLLGLDPAAQVGLSLAQSHDQSVADSLELARVEHLGPADGADAPVDPLARERRGEQLPEPALERSDLPTQVLAGEPLGCSGDAGAAAPHKRQGPRGHPRPDLLVRAKLRHRPVKSTRA
jgi:hypothetical protein